MKCFQPRWTRRSPGKTLSIVKKQRGRGRNFSLPPRPRNFFLHEDHPFYRIPRLTTNFPILFFSFSFFFFLSLLFLFSYFIPSCPLYVTFISAVQERASLLAAILKHILEWNLGRGK